MEVLSFPTLRWKRYSYIHLTKIKPKKAIREKRSDMLYQSHCQKHWSKRHVIKLKLHWERDISDLKLAEITGQRKNCLTINNLWILQPPKVINKVNTTIQHPVLWINGRVKSSLEQHHIYKGNKVSTSLSAYCSDMLFFISRRGMEWKF